MQKCHFCIAKSGECAHFATYKLQKCISKFVNINNYMYICTLKKISIVLIIKMAHNALGQEMPRGKH